MKRKRLSLLLAALATFTVSGAALAGAVPAYAAGTTYYVDNSTSNCSDLGSGTSTTAPWCGFTPVNAATFSPGDSILLKRGDTWNQEMDLHGSGTQSASISLSAYGVGARPLISRNAAESDRGIRMNNLDYWSISSLQITDAGVGILVYYDTKMHNGLSFNDLYFQNINGIVKGNTASAVADKVFFSSGISFTGSIPSIAANEWVLKGVTLTNIEGTRNQDTVKFDWNDSRSTGPYPAYQVVQNVLINRLYTHNDDGNGQSSSCSDSVGFFNVSHALIMNSIIDRPGSCYSNSGTAGIILSDVSDLRFVNNSFTNVPDTGSGDETAIDFEQQTENVTFDNNYIAGNAGAGLEFLTIHSDAAGHVAATVSSNTFQSNGLSTPTRGSIWVAGSAAAQPTGLISNNMYAETHPFLTTDDGGSAAGFTQTNNVPLATSTQSAYASIAGFSGTQGANGWSYQWEDAAGSWHPYDQYNSGSSVWNATTPNVGSIDRFDTIPGTAGAATAARTWTAPYSGVISIRGRALSSDTSGSAASTVTVYKNGSPLIQSQSLAPNDQTGVTTNADAVAVVAGDVLRFAVAGNSSGTTRAVSWTPSIGYSSIANAPETILTSQVPAETQSDARYELGTKFSVTVPGVISKVRLYAANGEAGAHTVRIWNSNGTLLAGPYTWTVSSGTGGWQEFALPTALSVSPGNSYIASISNSTDQLYTKTNSGFAAPISHGSLVTYTGSGMYSTTLGTIPNAVSSTNANYFRDIVFTAN